MEKTQAKYFCGTGRRKQAIAQVRLFKGTGKIRVIGDTKASIDPINDEVFEPLKSLGVEKEYDATVVLSGGGCSSRSEAIRLGIARALIKIDSAFETSLKKEGFLTRDPREKERKKPGLKRARKAPQWQKR